jgi:hypothetical protein
LKIIFSISILKDILVQKLIEELMMENINKNDLFFLFLKKKKGG